MQWHFLSAKNTFHRVGIKPYRYIYLDSMAGHDFFQAAAALKLILYCTSFYRSYDRNS
jgi:hypothetical protein